MNEEQKRLEEAREKKARWRRWGPYLSERQWGTVREDYSADGDAWHYFSFDDAAKRAYRWGEDGIFGISDNHQRVCFSFAFWNENDPILKERFFGLTNTEGNHGEDVKEYYYYLDSTPTHSYMKALYKYPQEAYPYERLREENRKRGPRDGEFELIDTGVFDRDRYFDLFVEYAKASPEDVLIRLTVCNRSDQPAKLHAIPQLWLRNTWSWKRKEKAGAIRAGERNLILEHPDLGSRFLYFEGEPAALFTENESNSEKLWGVPNPTPYVKDAFHEAIAKKNGKAVNPEKRGTKSALHFDLAVPAKGSVEVRLRLSDREEKKLLPISRRSLREEKKRPIAFTKRWRPIKSPPRERRFRGRLWRVFFGRSSAIITSLRIGWPATSRRRRQPGRRSATFGGDIFITTTSCRCPINGSIRGMPSGIWRFTASRSLWPIPILRRSNSLC
jgi:hypothetical protein